MKHNFDFLSTLSDFSVLYDYCHVAEINQRKDPKTSAYHARLALEYTVKIIYLLHNWIQPKQANLFELVDNEGFKQFINNPELMSALHYIRRAGNNAAHAEKVSPQEALFALTHLHTFVSAVLIKLGEVAQVAPFDKSLLGETQSSPQYVPPEGKDPSKKEMAGKPKLTAKDTLNAKNPQYFTEAETRHFYIDQQLREAGWDVLTTKDLIQPSKACIEIEVQGMPNEAGVGYVDYVLFGNDGKPLALIEAKRTSKDIAVGKQQAMLYADCLAQRYGVRPVIYYTNGYQTHIVDDLGYPSRQVFGFHTLNDLELLIQRKTRRHIVDVTINNSITDRPYQKQAITTVCEHFNHKHRRALLVMATGTGKTRVAISLIELLTRNNWIKNILFLADRTALVSQAHKNFTKLLPSITTCVLSDKTNKKEKDLNARIIFSTYHTMMNHIDSEVKNFSIGRFDLIIVDEAHRSIFGHFGAIFDYFDSLLVGLTATPRGEIDRSTYQIFGAEQGIPNFSYELEQAVAEHYLVPYKGFKRRTNHLRQGIKYNELSAEEKDQLEQVWKYETTLNEIDDEDYSRDIANYELFKYIFNEDTVDKVLQELMSSGLKVQSGELIGKTIIFAYNHKHAALLVERFEKLYPQYGAQFCSLIDYSVNYAQSLIDSFEVREKLPQIAVSVDMLDTGIDVPDILNLVFFKEVKSKIKFIQMVGRGTRLSPDIFGKGRDKKEFYIFDYCGNFEFFEVNPHGSDVKPIPTLTARLFGLKAEIAFELQSTQYQQDEYAKSLHDQIKAELQKQLASLNPHHINVRKQQLYVDKYGLEASWLCLSLVSLNELKTYIAPILSPIQEDESAKKFDLLILNIQLSLLNKAKKAGKSQQAVITALKALYEKGTIKEVYAKTELINEVLTETYWRNLSLDKLEHIRIELRDLMKYLAEDTSGQTFTVDIDDFIEDMGAAESIPSIKTYKQKVIDYLMEHSDSPVIQKIRQLEPITSQDIDALEKILWHELGSHDDYRKYTQSTLAENNVAIFIRSIIGLDPVIAEQRFSQFLSEHILNAQQQEYLKTIINYVNENGDITPDILTNESPFDNYQWVEVFGDKATNIPKYINTLHNVIIAQRTQPNS